MSAGFSRRIVVAVCASLLIAGMLGTTALASGASEPRGPEDRIVATFTKWITSFPAMAGVVGGAVGRGSFVGRVLNARDYAPDFQFTQLDAIYEFQGSEHSFTALIHGGESDQTGIGTLDGAILDGWLTGARVHVEFKTIPSCSGNPAGPCFQGTMRIEPDSGASD
jgi:hypothetical protein